MPDGLTFEMLAKTVMAARSRSAPIKALIVAQLMNHVDGHLVVRDREGADYVLLSYVELAKLMGATELQAGTTEPWGGMVYGRFWGIPIIEDEDLARRLVTDTLAALVSAEVSPTH